MTLKELFVFIKYKNDPRGAREAERSVDRIDNKVDDLEKSLEKVNKAFTVMSTVAVAGATTATIAYTNFSSKMVELAGKTGLSTKAFRELAAAETSWISRHIGGARVVSASAYQLGYSLGSRGKELDNLVRLGMMLHATNQAEGPTAVQSALKVSGERFGSADAILQKVYATSQGGAGEVPHYFTAIEPVAAIAAASDQKSIDDVLAMIGIGTKTGTVSEASTRTRAIISTFSKKNTKDAEELFRSRTGKDWSHLADLQSEKGTLAAIKFIKENFNNRELFTLFPREEAMALLPAIIEQLDSAMALRDDVSRAPEEKPIQEHFSDAQKEFFHLWRTFKNSITNLFQVIGKPFTQVITPFLKIGKKLVDGFIELNEVTNGLIAWIPVLLSGLILFTKGLFALSILRGIWSRLGTLLSTLTATNAVSGKDGAGKDGKKGVDAADKKGGIGRDAGLTLGGGIFGALISRFKDVISGVTKTFRGAFNLSKAMRGVAPLGVTPDKFVAGDAGAAKSFKMLDFFKSIKTPLIASGIIAAVLASLAGVFVLWSKMRSPESFDPSGRLTGHQKEFFEGGGETGEEPAPGWRDIRAHNRLVAEAELDSLWNEFQRVMSRGFIAFDNKLLIFMPTLATKFSNDLGTTLGEWIRIALASPGDAAAGAWDAAVAWRARFWSGILKFIGFGDDDPELSDQTEALQSDRLVTSTKNIPQWVLDQAGIKGNFAKSLQHPTLPIPETLRNKMVTVEIGDVIINTTSDALSSDSKLLENAEIMREEIRRQMALEADRIIQEMDYASP